ncbi:MAG: MBL fold metallo-hydrolase, partial [Thermoplasmata archaeon]|nr:MBL fold metallo-hydrolase [Thermoplasmata archaeon]
MTYRGSSRHFQTERLAPGVFAAIATPSGFGLCNAAIVDLGGATVVFDSMLTPMAGADLARAATRCTGRPPTWVVNSHWHGDHIWGN